MKCANVSKALVLGLTMLLATTVFASSNKGSLQLTNDVTVSGKTLDAGQYALNWQGSGSNVQLNILKGKKVVATTPARLVDLSASSPSDAAIVKNNGDGSSSLQEVRFGGKKFALQIGEEQASTEAGSASK
jgi:hypothetical protein